MTTLPIATGIDSNNNVYTIYYAWMHYDNNTRGGWFIPIVPSQIDSQSWTFDIALPYFHPTINLLINGNFEVVIGSETYFVIHDSVSWDNYVQFNNELATFINTIIPQKVVGNVQMIDSNSYLELQKLSNLSTYSDFMTLFVQSDKSITQQGLLLLQYATFNYNTNQQIQYLVKLWKLDVKPNELISS